MEVIEALKRKRTMRFALSLFALALIIAARCGLAVLENTGLIPQGSIVARFVFIAVVIALSIICGIASLEATVCSKEIKKRESSIGLK